MRDAARKVSSRGGEGRGRPRGRARAAAWRSVRSVPVQASRVRRAGGTVRQGSFDGVTGAGALCASPPRSSWPPGATPLSRRARGALTSAQGHGVRQPAARVGSSDRSAEACGDTTVSRGQPCEGEDAGTPADPDACPTRRTRKRLFRARRCAGANHALCSARFEPKPERGWRGGCSREIGARVAVPRGHDLRLEAGRGRSRTRARWRYGAGGRARRPPASSPRRPRGSRTGEDVEGSSWLAGPWRLVHAAVR
jgi:hypothetical protein